MRQQSAACALLLASLALSLGCESSLPAVGEPTEARESHIIGFGTQNVTAAQTLPARGVGWIKNPNAGFPLSCLPCSATPIKRDVILTAGHCLCLDKNAGAPANSVTFHLTHIDPATGALVDVGPNKTGIQSKRIEVDTLFCDPFQTIVEPSTKAAKDLGILVLSSPLSLDDLPELPEVYTLPDFLDRAVNRPDDAGFFGAPWEIIGWDSRVPSVPNCAGVTLPEKRLATRDDLIFDRFKVFQGGIFCDVGLCTNSAPGVWIHDPIDVVRPAGRIELEGGDSGGPITFRQNHVTPTIFGVASIANSTPIGTFNSWSPTWDNSGLDNGSFISQFLDDADGDGVSDVNDNCTPPRCNSKETCFNPGQDDRDLDGIGDTCDNCPPSICTQAGALATSCANPAQEDRGDHDGIGDVCDLCPGKATSRFEQDTNHDGIGDSCDSCPRSGGGGRRACKTSSDCGGRGFCITTDIHGGRCGDGSNRACNTFTGFLCLTCLEVGQWGVCSESKEPDTDGDGFGDRCDGCPNFSDANLQQNSNVAAEGRQGAIAVNDACDSTPLFTSRPVVEPVGSPTISKPRTLFTSFAGVGSDTSIPHAPFIGAQVGFRHCDCPPDQSPTDCLNVVCGDSRAPFDDPADLHWKVITLGASPAGNYSEAQVSTPILDLRLDPIYTGGIDCSDPLPHQTFVNNPPVTIADKNLCRVGVGTGRLVSWATDTDIDAGRVTSFTGIPAPISGEGPFHTPVRQTVGMFWSHGVVPTPFVSAGNRDSAFGGQLRDNYVYLKTPSVSFDVGSVPRIVPVTPTNCAFNPQCWEVISTDWLKPLIRPGIGLNVLRLLPRPFVVFPNCTGSGTLCGIRRSTEPHIDLGLTMTTEARLALLDSTRILVTPVESSLTDVSLTGGIVAVSVPRSWSQLGSDIEGLGGNFAGTLDTIAVFQADSESRPENVTPFAGERFVPSDREGARWLFSKTEQALYMIGGTRGEQPTAEVWRLDLLSAAWKHLFMQGTSTQLAVRNVAGLAYDSPSGKLLVIDDAPGSSPQSARLTVFDAHANTSTIAALLDLRSFTKVGLAATGGGSYVLVGAKQTSWTAYRFQVTSANRITWLGRASGQGLVIADPLPWQEGPGLFVQTGQDFNTVDLPVPAFTPAGTPPELVVCDQPLVVPPPPAIVISTCHLPALQPPTPTSACGPVSVDVAAPADFQLGSSTITWTLTDALGNVVTVPQTVTAVLGDDASCCPAGTNVIMGTSNNDVLVGTSGSDCILGLGAQDNISGGGGDDYINGGDGDDVIDGGSGNDHLWGGSGQDQITGGIGNDVIDGGEGDDTCHGNDGDDGIHGGNGQDHLFGDNGNDKLFGDAGDDTLDGGPGNDSLNGGGLHDVCIGGTGTNTFTTCQTIR